MRNGTLRCSVVAFFISLHFTRRSSPAKTRLIFIRSSSIELRAVVTNNWIGLSLDIKSETDRMTRFRRLICEFHSSCRLSASVIIGMPKIYLSNVKDPVFVINDEKYCGTVPVCVYYVVYVLVTLYRVSSFIFNKKKKKRKESILSNSNYCSSRNSNIGSRNSIIGNNETKWDAIIVENQLLEWIKEKIAFFFCTRIANCFPFQQLFFCIHFLLFLFPLQQVKDGKHSN